MELRVDNLSERLLVLRCQTGDAAAYRELIRLFGPRLRYFLAKIAASPDRAEDLAQEVWLDVLRQLPRLQNSAAFKTWLYKIAYGKAMLDLRRRGRLPRAEADSEQLEQVEDPSENDFSSEDVARVHLAIDRLRPSLRDVIVLRFMEELTYDEIGLIVQCPVGTVRSRIYYAKQQLRRILDIESA